MGGAHDCLPGVGGERIPELLDALRCCFRNSSLAEFVAATAFRNLEHRQLQQQLIRTRAAGCASLSPDGRSRAGRSHALVGGMRRSAL